MGLLAGVLALALAAVGPQESPGVPDILQLLDTADEPRLLEEVRTRPNDAREALAKLFEFAVRAGDSNERVPWLDQADRL